MFVAQNIPIKQAGPLATDFFLLLPSDDFLIMICRICWKTTLMKSNDDSSEGNKKTFTIHSVI